MLPVQYLSKTVIEPESYTADADLPSCYCFTATDLNRITQCLTISRKHALVFKRNVYYYPAAKWFYPFYQHSTL